MSEGMPRRKSEPAESQEGLGFTENHKAAAAISFGILLNALKRRGIGGAALSETEQAKVDSHGLLGHLGNILAMSQEAYKGIETIEAAFKGQEQKVDK